MKFALITALTALLANSVAIAEVERSEIACGLSKEGVASPLKAFALKIGESTNWIKIPNEGVEFNFSTEKMGKIVRSTMELTALNFSLQAQQDSPQGPYNAQIVNVTVPGKGKFTLICGQ